MTEHVSESWGVNKLIVYQGNKYGCGVEGVGGGCREGEH